MSASMEECEVVVVGGGPVGLTTAAALHHYGVKTTLVEKKRTVSPFVKAQFVSGRSTEHFRRIGLEKVLMDASWARDQTITMRACNQLLHGNEFLRMKFSSWGDIVDGVPGARGVFFEAGTSVCPPLLCPQSELEPVLLRHVEGCKNVSLLCGWEVTGLEQDEMGATLTLANDKGERKRIRAKFVVACDGGKSAIRKALNVHTYGTYIFARAVSVMLKSDDLYARLGGVSGRGFGVVSNSVLSGALFNLKADGEYALHMTFYTEEKANEAAQNPNPSIDTFVGEKVEYTITASSRYNMHGLMSTKFRVGRCFFAGDSAHQWVPVGGLGMNTGIDDAFNLTWKIAAVLKGYGGSQLLDSYEIERKAASDTVRRFVLGLGNTAGVGKAKLSISSLLLSMPLPYSLLHPILTSQTVSLSAGGQKYVFGLQYSTSNVISHEYDPSGNQRFDELSTSTKFVPQSLPGLRAPHVALPNCESILDLFGKGFVLLTIDAHQTDCRQLREELEKRGVPITTHAFSKLPELSALYDRKYFLVRPDGVICWRSDVQPSAHEARRIVSVILGDNPRKRYLPVLSPKKKSPMSLSLIFDAAVATKIGCLLHKYAGLSFNGALAAGLGAFWFLRRYRTVPTPISLDSIGRHKAAVIKGFGEPEDVFEIAPRYTQLFGPDDILVRVRAVSVNPLDIKVRRGYIAPLLQRLARYQGRGSVFPVLLGRDCSGEVVAVGDNVTKFVTGDEVFALSGFLGGTYAQLAVVSEKSVALKPQTVDHREAASVAYVAATAYTALVENVGLSRSNTRGKKVLVHGGTGGVGSFSVQLLKAWGAEVTVTCSAENIALATSLGADRAIDYKQEDFSKLGRQYDVVFDTIGGSNYESRSLRVLKAFSGASYVSIISPKFSFLGKFPPILGDILFSWYYRLKIVLNRILGGRAFYYSVANTSSEALEVAGEMVDRGEIKPVIDAVYSLDEIVAAHQHVEEGHTRGKVVIAMD